MSDVPLIKRFLQSESEFLAYLMAITRSFDAAEEIFQNAAVVVMEHAASGKKEIKDFRAWSKEVIRRQALFYLRNEGSQTRKTRPMEPLLMEQVTRAFIENDAGESLRNQEMLALRRCIYEVPDQQRQMLSLRYEGKASFRDIGAVVGKSEGAVQRALSRLRKKLYDCVQKRLRLTELTT